MTDGGENPFKAAARRPEDDPGARITPFGDVVKRPSPPKLDQLRTIEELNLLDAATLTRNPRVAKLTVRDLNDLAAQFSGIPTNNPVIGELTIEDMQDIEGIFLEFKLNAARDIAGGRMDLAAVDVSCCCCTPCCCCAAAEVDPVLA